jgi:hypothetical protein
MSTPENVERQWRGSLGSPYNHPRKAEARIHVVNEARQQIVHRLVSRPGSAYAEYDDFIGKASDHGRMYLWTGQEEVRLRGFPLDRYRHCLITAHFTVTRV